MSQTEIKATENGPYLVTGDLDQLDLRDALPLRRIDDQAVLRRHAFTQRVRGGGARRQGGGGRGHRPLGRVSGAGACALRD